MKALLLVLFCSFAQAGEVLKAFYEVPVSLDLSKFANYELDYFTNVTEDDTFKMIYELPRELTGKPQRITFSGKIVKGQTPKFLASPLGEMRCGLIENYVQNCTARYRGIEVDLDQVARLLKARNASPEETAGRLRVANDFRNGGGGIITYVYESLED